MRLGPGHPASGACLGTRQDASRCPENLGRAAEAASAAEAAAAWSLERRRPIPPAKRTAPSGEAAGPRHETAARGVLGWKSPPSTSSLKVIHGCSNPSWSWQRPFLSERYLGRQGPHRSICHSRIGHFITQLTCAYIMRNGEPNAPIL